MEFNYKAVLQMISPQHELSTENAIHLVDLSLEAIAGLSKHKKPYVAFASRQHVLTHIAKETIKEHLFFHLNNEDEGTESFSASISSVSSEDVSIVTDDFEKN